MYSLNYLPPPPPSTRRSLPSSYTTENFSDDRAVELTVIWAISQYSFTSFKNYLKGDTFKNCSTVLLIVIELVDVCRWQCSTSTNPQTRRRRWYGTVRKCLRHTLTSGELTCWNFNFCSSETGSGQTHKTGDIFQVVHVHRLSGKIRPSFASLSATVYDIVQNNQSVQQWVIVCHCDLVTL